MASLASAGLTWPAFKNANLGPFEVGGNLYSFGWDDPNNTIECWKSTNAGVDWAEVDGAGSRPSSTSQHVLDVRYLSPNFYVLYYVSGTALQVAKFSTSSDTWQALETGMTTSPPNPGITHITSLVAAMLAVRADGNYVVMHQGATVMDMGSEFRTTVYSRFQAGAWTVNQAVAGGASVNADCRAIARLPNDGQTLLFYTRTDSAGTLFFKQLSDANSLGSEDTVTADERSTIASTSYPTGLPAIRNNGTNDVAVVSYFSSAQRLALTEVTGAGGNPSTDLGDASDVSPTTDYGYSVVMDNSDYHVFFRDLLTSDLWHDQDTGSGFGTDEEIADAVTVQGVSANLITNAIGILYSNAGVVTFLSYELAAGNPEATIASTLAKLEAALTAEQPHETTVASRLASAEGAFTATMQPSGTIASRIAPVRSSLNAAQEYLTTIASRLANTESALTAAQEYLTTVASRLAPVESVLTAVMQPASTIASRLAPTESTLTVTQKYLTTIASLLEEVKAALTVSQSVDTVDSDIASRLAPAESSLMAEQVYVTTLASRLANLESALTATMQPEATIASRLAPTESSLTAAQVYVTSIASRLAELVSIGTLTHEQASTIASRIDSLDSSLTATMQPASTIASRLAELASELAAAQVYETTIVAILAPVAAALQATHGAPEATIASTIAPVESSLDAEQPYETTIESRMAPTEAALSATQEYISQIASTLATTAASLAVSHIQESTIASILANLEASLTASIPTTVIIDSRLAVTFFGGTLVGQYPAPHIAIGVVTLVHVALAGMGLVNSARTGMAIVGRAEAKFNQVDSAFARVAVVHGAEATIR